jgi:hypothetical protein
MKLQEAAQQTVSNAYKDSKPAIFIEILMIISIIAAIVGIIQRCSTPEEVVKNAKKPSGRHRWLMKRIMRKKLPYEQYKSENAKLISGMLDTASNSSVEDIQQLFEEVNNYKE